MAERNVTRQHDVLETRVNEVEIMFNAIRELARAAGSANSDERWALVLAIEQMSLVGVGKAGALARQVGREPFGLCLDELHELAGKVSA